MKRNKYHTAVKLAFALGIEKEWLSDDFIKDISRSTYNPWRKLHSDDFVGHEFAIQIKENLDELRTMYDQRVAKEKKLMLSIMRLKITLVNIIGKETIKNAFKDNFRKVVQVVEQCKHSFHTKKGSKIICSFLDIKYRTLCYWKSVSSQICTISPLGVCLRKVPNQATPKEIRSMQRLLKNKRLLHWPICSVWAWATKRKINALSLPTWYRYNTKYQFRIKPKKGQFKKKYDPLRAPRPNHTWHADITIVHTLDGMKHYLYLIVDNFSKMIVNWKIHNKVSGDIRKLTIQEAIEQEFSSERYNNIENQNVDLIVDGGSENHSQVVEEFIRNAPVHIQKKIALKDIKQSNAIVEASNKTVKSRYINLSPSANLECLLLDMEKHVEDLCYIRPHCSLENLQTPAEAHYDTPINFNTNYSKKAIKERVNSNKTNFCNQDC